MEYEEKTLTCQNCGQTFVFSAEEQSFYASKGYMNEPKRCESCRAERRGPRNDGPGYIQREMYPVVCAACGKDTTVPFQPRGDRPVYCRECFSKQRPAVQARR
ncbi:MAG: zinc-ribbon domain containing protein [Chloroflexi bacterium]|nr:zinc-ribbon domain containing protein [Chloroflexota bacterium]